VGKFCVATRYIVPPILIVGVIAAFFLSKQQSRHQEKYCYHTENNGFRQDNTHIVTNSELHEHHGKILCGYPLHCTADFDRGCYCSIFPVQQSELCI